MPLTTYLFFNGNCGEAMHFYERTLKGKLDLMTYAESPDPLPADVQPGKIMHAQLLLEDGTTIMASDHMGGAPYREMSGFSVCLFVPDAAQAKRIYDALSENGEIRMPMQKTFWSEAFGIFSDRFGTPWMVGTGAEQ